MGLAGQCSTMHALLTPSPSAGCPLMQCIPPREDHDSAHMPSTAQFRRSLPASGIAWACTLLAWDQFTGSDHVDRVPIERKLARVPAPRVFPREPKSLLQANITIDHRSQITERELQITAVRRKNRITERYSQKEEKRERAKQPATSERAV